MGHETRVSCDVTERRPLSLPRNAHPSKILLDSIGTKKQHGESDGYGYGLTPLQCTCGMHDVGFHWWSSTRITSEVFIYS